jgi:hypothetical protein
LKKVADFSVRFTSNFTGGSNSGVFSFVKTICCPGKTLLPANVWFNLPEQRAIILLLEKKNKGISKGA